MRLAGLKYSKVVLGLLITGCSFIDPAQETSASRGWSLLRQGNYKEALSTFNAVLEKRPSDVDAQLGLVQTQIEIGDYPASEKRIKEFLANSSDETRLRAMYGELLLTTGRYKEAESEFERSASGAKGPVWLRAMLGHARALFQQGRESEAGPILQQFISYYNSNSPKTAEELTLIARALTYLEKYKDANELYIDAREIDPGFTEAYVWQGELLNQKYNYGEAASLFRDALKSNPNHVGAHVGLAESKRFESNSEPVASVEQALSVNPNHPGGLALKATLELETERFEAASQTIQRALSVNPNSVEALAVRAAILYIEDRKVEFESEIKRALGINPKGGEFFNILAHFAVQNRRYHDAVEFGKRAVELSPRLWAARTQLGIQLVRTGREAEGRTELERAFAGDPFNVWAKNSLDLLDSMREYRDNLRGPFLVRSSQQENDVVASYAADLLEEAHKKLSTKYRFSPKSPISVELFPNHEDFAVRSLGLPGLGALGVCFGQVIAMDGPLAREKGEFNWGGTLWHEFAHVVTLQITNYRIPRWFSEGLSVYEERRARPGWGDNWSLERLKAFAEGRFVKINDLDAAFTRPRSPEQIPLAYFQASLVCEFVEEKHGFDAILNMLSLYKDGVKTPDVLERALSVKPEDFDKRFNEYVRGKTAGLLEAVASGPGKAGAEKPAKESLLGMLRSKPNDYFAHLRLGALYKSEGDAEQAIHHLKRAIELFPFYGGEGNPYALLADLHEARGQKAEAAAALAGLVQVNETSFDAMKRLAILRSELGDKAGALETLRISFYIYPFEAALHKLAGDLYLEQGDSDKAVREFAVVVSLKPADLAGAHYDSARALAAAGKAGEARKAVLRALEIAPGFEKAQEFLLKLRGNNP